jgi:uncharacterized protein YjeT (DUF2065 family)
MLVQMLPIPEQTLRALGVLLMAGGLMIVYCAMNFLER